MKKFILSAAVLALGALSVQAQEELTWYEVNQNSFDGLASASSSSSTSDFTDYYGIVNGTELRFNGNRWWEDMIGYVTNEDPIEFIAGVQVQTGNAGMRVYFSNSPFDGIPADGASDEEFQLAKDANGSMAWNTVTPAGDYKYMLVTTAGRPGENENLGWYFNSFKFAVKVNVGVEGIATENNAPAQYYTLNGTRVSGDLAKGMYVRVQDGKASKVMVK